MGRPSLERRSDRETLASGPKPTDCQGQFLPLGLARSDRTPGTDTRRRTSAQYASEGRAALHNYVSRRSQEIDEINRMVFGADARRSRASCDAAVARIRAETDVQFHTCRNLESFLADAPSRVPENKPSAELPWNLAELKITEP